MKTKNNIEVQYITIDPDTKRFKADTEHFVENITNTEPHFLFDSRQLSEKSEKMC